MPRELPTDQVLDMIDQGRSNQEIIIALQGEGYSNQQIQDALAQAQTKVSVEGTIQQEIPPPPVPGMQPSMLNAGGEEARFQPVMQEQFARPMGMDNISNAREIEERIEEIAEQVIDEKWRKVIEDVGDLSSWKERMVREIMSVKQEVVRIQGRFESLQKAVLEKVRDYDRGIEDVGSDIKAVEMLLQNILDPLATNVKELKKITEKLKK